MTLSLLHSDFAGKETEPMKSPYFVVISARSADEAFNIFTSELRHETTGSSSQWLYGISEMVQPKDYSDGFILVNPQPSAACKHLQSCMMKFLEVQDQLESGKCLLMQIPESDHEWAVCGFAGTVLLRAEA